VEAAERYADGELTQEDFMQAEEWYLAGEITEEEFVRVGGWDVLGLLSPDEAFAQAVHEIAIQAAAASGEAYGAPDEERFMQAELLRDVCGNPFRPVTFGPFWLRWNGGIVGHLARQIYEERRFGEMPVLGDALEDAGCADEDILAHCRGPHEHVRGCWVLDLLLGKE
jgi:hypothetical protein